MRSGGRSVIWSGRRSGIRPGMIKTQSQNEEIKQIEKMGWRKVWCEVGLHLWREVKVKVKSKVWGKLFE
jgi:hypothetical protein